MYTWPLRCCNLGPSSIAALQTRERQRSSYLPSNQYRSPHQHQKQLQRRKRPDTHTLSREFARRDHAELRTSETPRARSATTRSCLIKHVSSAARPTRYARHPVARRARTHAALLTRSWLHDPRHAHTCVRCLYRVVRRAEAPNLCTYPVPGGRRDTHARAATHSRKPSMRREMHARAVAHTTTPNKHTNQRVVPPRSCRETRTLTHSHRSTK